MKKYFKKFKHLFSFKKTNKNNKVHIIYMNDEPEEVSILNSYKVMTYHISSLEQWRIDQFKNAHKKICHPNEHGHYYTMFSSDSGIGYSISCMCKKCGQICDVTDVSNW